MTSTEKEFKLETTPIKIDPTNLLNQVDSEINTTFRQKVLKKINKNYKKARETVAYRNLE